MAESVRYKTCKVCGKPIKSSAESSSGWVHTKGSAVYNHPNTAEKPVEPK